MELATGRHGTSDAPLPIAPQPARRAGPGKSTKISPQTRTVQPAEQDEWTPPPPVTLADGTRVQLYKDGEGLLAAYQAIKSARRFIGLEVYIFAEDDTGRAFADLLCEKARQGLRVFVIYDAFGTRGFTGAEPAMFQRMRNCGARVQVFHPTRPWECLYSWRPANRDHRKLLVIDGDIAGLGGLNIGREYGGSGLVPKRLKKNEYWRDNAIGVTGRGAHLFMHSFHKTWNYVKSGGRIRRAEYIQHPFDGELGVLAPAPTLNSPLRPFLHRLLREAKRTLLMTMAYFAPDDPLIDGLCKAARRGVRVRLMLPGQCDVPLVRICGRSFYDTLLTAGVEIYERQGVILHAKTMVVDEETTIIGSTNLDYRSIEYNCELSAIIHSAAFGRQMCGLFENDVKFADQIKLPEWRKRPVWDRFVQWSVSRGRYLL
ncbi:MAG TPA: phospholipase D-like domain-containing protein [Tepidisphaeraceae bacterium]|nr:phospholipase D-like domain-containing protein [Tepidisphaeraceae bacterium]